MVELRSGCAQSVGQKFNSKRENCEYPDVVYLGNKWLQNFVGSDKFTIFISTLIVLNSVVLGILTMDLNPSTANTLHIIDHIILMVFVVEIIVRLFAYGRSYFDDNWNSFDLIIVGVSALTVFSSLSVLRTFRVVKVLRLFRVFPELRRMIESTSRSLRSIVAISALLSLVIYVFAVMSVMLFGHIDGVGKTYFGNLGLAIFSLFQVMTLDSWAEGMVRQLIDDKGLWVGAYFGIFILATTFTFLNMFIAVFTNAIASVDIEDGDDVGFSRIINELKQEISDLKQSVILHAVHMEEE